ncbi:MAG: hypothetical protein IJL66_05195 [Lachnospiraceae bacterium]|nr:hypothetical protein [Lachnospiraceae bacterium]
MGTNNQTHAAPASGEGARAAAGQPGEGYPQIDYIRHPPMPREERAKQFLPFAAIKVLPEALRRAEEEAARRAQEVRERTEE